MADAGRTEIAVVYVLYSVPAAVSVTMRPDVAASPTTVTVPLSYSRARPTGTVRVNSLVAVPLLLICTVTVAATVSTLYTVNLSSTRNWPVGGAFIASTAVAPVVVAYCEEGVRFRRVALPIVCEFPIVCRHRQLGRGRRPPGPPATSDWM